MRHTALLLPPQYSPPLIIISISCELGINNREWNKLPLSIFVCVHIDISLFRLFTHYHTLSSQGERERDHHPPTYTYYSIYKNEIGKGGRRDTHTKRRTMKKKQKWGRTQEGNKFVLLLHYTKRYLALDLIQGQGTAKKKLLKNHIHCYKLIGSIDSFFFYRTKNTYFRRAVL